MFLPRLDELILAVLTFLILAIMLAVIILWGWAVPKLVRGVPLLSSDPILPLQPARWGGRTVFAVILLYLGANLVTGMGYGAANRALRPAATPEPAAKADAPEESKPVEESADEKSEEPGSDEKEAEPTPSYSNRTALILNAIAGLLFLVLLPKVLRSSAAVGPSDLGLSWKEWRRQVQVGKIAALLTVPVVYAVQALAVQVWEVHEHPVQQMMADQLSPDAAVLALFTTVLLAPLVEETLFRGVILGWLSRVFSAFPVTPPPVLIARDGDHPTAASSESQAETEPIPSTAAMEPLPVVTSADAIRPNPVCFPAIITSSLLFAGMHASQWPAPVGIFFLAMVLGVVYQRTGSLLTAMVLHGVFNGCSTLLLLQGVLARSIQEAVPTLPENAPQLQPAIRIFLEWWSWWV